MTEERPDSFPYLHLSRRLYVPYRDVLAYVDQMEKRQTVGFYEELDVVDKCAVQDVWMHEQLRRIPERQE